MAGPATVYVVCTVAKPPLLERLYNIYMSHLEDARRIGQLEATLKMLPHSVMFSPHFESVPIEERIKVAKALELLINDSLKTLNYKRAVM